MPIDIRNNVAYNGNISTVWCNEGVRKMPDEQKSALSKIAENFNSLPQKLKERLSDIAYGMRLAMEAEARAEQTAES